jgi:hypothetical protein
LVDPGQAPDIDHLSAGTMRQIAAWEHRHAYPGSVARDLKWWQSLVGRTEGELSELDREGYAGLPCCDPEPNQTRAHLEAVLNALSTGSRREFQALLTPVDEYLERRLIDDPYRPGFLLRWRG